MAKKLKTINLSGKQYAQVAERLRAIHEDHKDFDIITNFTITEAGNIVFTATLTLRDKAENPVTYTGHSFGKNGQLKAFEKLETIAVGRALAFAGYHADGEIASADEMKEYGNEQDQEAVTEAVFKIQEAKTVPELNKAYKALPLAIQHHKDIIQAGKIKKAELSTIS